MHGKRRQRSLGQNGLTLLETLLTLSLVAVLLGIGLPTLQDQLADGRARAAAEQLLAGAQFARGTAQRLRRPVVLCPIKHPEAAVPECEGDFGGLLGAVLVHSDGAKVLKIWSPLEGVDVANRAGSARVTSSVTWDARGLGNRNLILSVCAAERNWSAVINRLGRPRLSEAWGVCSNSLVFDDRYPVSRPAMQTPWPDASSLWRDEIRYPSPPDRGPKIPL